MPSYTHIYTYTQTHIYILHTYNINIERENICPLSALYRSITILKVSIMLVRNYLVLLISLLIQQNELKVNKHCPYFAIVVIFAVIFCSHYHSLLFCTFNFCNFIFFLLMREETQRGSIFIFVHVYVGHDSKAYMLSNFREMGCLDDFALPFVNSSKNLMWIIWCSVTQQTIVEGEIKLKNFSRVNRQVRKSSRINLLQANLLLEVPL